MILATLLLYIIGFHYSIVCCSILLNITFLIAFVFFENLDLTFRFNPVVGGGVNGSVIHYSRNDQNVRTFHVIWLTEDPIYIW